MKVLGKLSEPGRPANLDNSRTRANCACSRCGWGTFLLSSIISLVFLWETARYRLKYCLKGPLSSIQPTNGRFFRVHVVIVFQELLGVVGWCEGAG